MSAMSIANPDAGPNAAALAREPADLSAIWRALAAIPDPEIPVVSIVDLGIVRSVAREEGGVSHFHLLRDNLRIGWMHTRLSMTALMWRPLLRLFGRGQRSLPAAR